MVRRVLFGLAVLAAFASSPLLASAQAASARVCYGVSVTANGQPLVAQGNCVDQTAP